MLIIYGLQTFCKYAFELRHATDRHAIIHMLHVTRYRPRSLTCLTRKVTFTHLTEVPRQLQIPY